MKHFSHHLPHYLSLVGILLVGLFGFLIFSYDRGFQMAIVISVAIGYFVWGLVHHAIHGDLYWPVVVEYAVIASLGLVVVFSLVLRT